MEIKRSAYFFERELFLRGGYAEAADWELLYDCNNGRLEWLEYNVKRVLGIDCGDDFNNTSKIFSAL